MTGCSGRGDASPLEVFDALVFGFDVGDLLIDVERAKKSRPRRPKSKRAGAKAMKRLDKKLRNVLQRAWVKGGEEVTEQSLEVLAAGAGDVTEAEINELLIEIEARMGVALATGVATKVGSILTESYSVGRRLFVTRPQFNLVDMKAQTWLAENHQYWIGKHYGEHVGPKIAKSVKTNIIEAGLSRGEAGKALKGIFGNTVNRPDHYWRGLAANATTRARNFGAVKSFEEAGFASLEVVAVMDEATSEICQEMNGKIFKVELASKQRDDLMAAEDPEDVKKIAPWPKLDDIEGKDPEALAAEAGVVLPPYHYHCRTVVVAS